MFEGAIRKRPNLPRMSLRLLFRIKSGLKKILLYSPTPILPGKPAAGVDQLWRRLHQQGVHTAGFLILRVIDSVSFGMLLILTTPWTNILVSLRWFRLPPLIVD